MSNVQSRTAAEVRSSTTDAVWGGIPFVGILLFWIAVTAVVYGGFVAVWPEEMLVTEWQFLGVYLLPVIGYLGHTLQYALRSSLRAG